MYNDVTPPPQQPMAEEQAPAAGSRLWIWAIALGVGLLAAPGFLIALLQQQRVRQFVETLPMAADAPLRIAPAWVPMREEFRLEESYRGAQAGSATLLSGEGVEVLHAFYQLRLRERGFQVSGNRMQQDNEVTTAIVNASHPGGQTLFVTLSRGAFERTRIELAYSE